MEHILTPQTNLPLVLEVRIFFRASCIGVVDFPCATVAAHFHLIWKQWIESEDISSAIAQYLCVCISPQEEMRHERFAQDETRHLRIRRVVEQEIQRMLVCDLLAAFPSAIDSKRQTRDGFGEDAHTCVDRRRLHGSALIDRLARRRLPEQKGQASKMISGLVPRTEKFAE